MSDVEELVVVDASDEMFDPINTDEPLAIESGINLDPRLNESVNNQLTYDDNPYGILICSKFKVRSDFEDIADSVEKRCHFSVEGNEISVRFPLRGEDASSMRDRGARMVIDFIMNLDRVPARLAELMSVPGKQVKRTEEVPILANKKRKIRAKRESNKHLSDIETITTELTRASLPPKFLQVARRAANNHFRWKVTTTLPGLDVQFMAIEDTSVSAKLSSVTKAVNFARSHDLGGFGEPELQTLGDAFYHQDEHSFPPTRYPRQASFRNVRQQRHVSVHSRLAPPLPAPPRYFEDSYPPFPDLNPPVQRAPAYEYYEDSPELDFTPYPAPYFPPPMAALRYMHTNSWRGGRGRERRGRGGRSMLKRGKRLKSHFEL